MKLFKVAAALLCAAGISAFASTTSVTATLIDGDAVTWANCTWTAVVSSPVPPTIAGVPVPDTSLRANGSCSSSGVLTGTMLDTSSVQQAGVTWTFTIHPNSSVPPSVVSGVVVTGASISLSATLSAALVEPRFSTGTNSFGYADIEVLPYPPIGSSYFNTGTVCSATGGTRQFSLAGWQCGGGGSTSGPLAGTALADYRFQDATGTTVSDSSGNGNSGTFIGGAATWVSGGLKFTAASPFQGVALPPAVNVGQTFEIVAYVDPLPTTGNGLSKSDQYPLFVNNTNGLAGLTLLYTGGQAGLYNLGINAGGGTTTATTQTFAGFHVYTYVLGTSGGNLDHIYIDGVELPYTNHGFSANKQVGGNLTISGSGISPYNISGFIGTMYRLRILSGQITSGQVATDANALLNQEAALGVQITPPSYLQNTPQLHLIGDSLTCEWNGTVCSTAYSWGAQLVLTNQPAYTITNWGIYGTFMQAMQASEPWRVSPYCKTNQGPAIAINAGATNDLQYRIVSLVAQTAAAFVSPLKNAGCDVFITSILSRVGNSNATGTPTNDSQKNNYDALVAAQWKSWGYKGYIDWGANPVLGADGAYANTTYFLADGVHNTAAGALQKAIATSNALNYYYSIYSESSPHVIAATTSLTSADAAVSIGTLSGAIALTMPDCTGPTGATYTIANPQAAQVVTLVGLNASQPINGLTSAITIPNNSSVKLTVVVNPYITSGCHWSM